MVLEANIFRFLLVAADVMADDDVAAGDAVDWLGPPFCCS